MRRLILQPDGPQRERASGVEDNRLRQRFRIGPDGKLAREARLGDTHARIQRQYAVRIDQKRINVDLRDFGPVDDKLRHLHQGEAKRVDINPRPVPIAAQQSRDPRAVDQVPRQDHVERR